METLWEYGIIAVRIGTVFPLLLAMTLFMGRRSIGELPVFDFLIILTLGSVVGADIAEPDIQHLPTAYAIVLIALLQKGVAIASVRYRLFGRLVTFEPLVMIHEGILQFSNLKKAKYSVDNILQMLREEQVFDIALVHLAVLEANGRLSVMLRPDAAPATAAQVNAPADKPDLSYPVIMEGKIQAAVLAYLGLNEDWVRLQLQAQSARMENVFIGLVDKHKQLTLHAYYPASNTMIPPIHH